MILIIMAVIFIVVCVSATSYNKGLRHHDSRHDSFYATSHRKDD